MELNSAAAELAVNGGPAVFPSGPPPWPVADDDVRIALEKAYRDGSWGKYHGHHCDRLIRALTEFHAVEFATLCCSGTVAVELALRGLDVRSGDEVILAGYDFPGNFRAIEAIGARPVVVDIASSTWTINVDQLDEAVNQTTKAIVVSHLHGGLAPMQHIMQWAGSRGLSVVEDACQAPGAVVDNQLAATWGDAGILSFGGSKLLTAGRGGAILTSRADVHQRVKIFSERGNDAFPMSQLQAAVLLPQLDKLTARNQIRVENATRLSEASKAFSCLRPIEIPGRGMRASYYKFAWMYDPNGAGGHSRSTFLSFIQAEGAAIDVGFRGFARRSSRRCRQISDLACSQAAAEGTVLLHHPVLLQDQSAIDKLRLALNKVATALDSTPC